MYTFLVTYIDMDGGDDQKLSIGVDICCVDNEDLKGMDPDQYAWIRAVESASFYIEKSKPAFNLSLGSIEFISC